MPSKSYLFYDVDGVEVLVRFAPGPAASDEQLVAAGDRIVEAAETLDATIERLGTVVGQMVTRLKASITEPDETEIVLHANLSGKAGIKIFEVGAEAGIEIHARWKRAENAD